VIGGSLLLDSIRSMFGHEHAVAAGAYEPVAPTHSPWDDHGAANNELSREAGANDINDSSHHQDAGLFDTADSDNDNDNDNDNDYDDGDVAGDFDGDYDGGGDVA
jgi:hypothetical protein